MVAKVTHADPQQTIPRKTYVPIGCLVAFHMLPLDRTPGGLLIPENTKNPYATQRCLVIAAGPECKWVKEGDEVLCFNNAHGIIHEGQTTGLIREENIAGIVLKCTCGADRTGPSAEAHSDTCRMK